MPLKLKTITILVVFTLIPSPFLKCEAVGVKIGYGWSINPDEAKAVQEAIVMMRKTITKPDLVILFAEASYENDEVIARHLSKLTNGAKIYGIEGTYAIFTGDGIHVGEKGSLAILGIEAPSWNVGIGVKDMSDAKTPMQIKERSISAIEDAIRDAGKTKEDEPSLVLVAPTSPFKVVL
ncbi:hypothetical protein DSCO28_43420 [Desulfosarcina ovata subsp. sediminis]|uniref:FIST domain-containing protein n=1 Tax=Desulfosarcina ovata subsp. sediminis TaxID=885957 RepID=A0A5K7ZU70_9BACT|nr:hypothetical protein [Desulfosarcina ovata]BBO83776.1 hypothetical protein DSCO28_43420 [Desulfosarcina ovata subsp. sediminis]